MSTTTALTITVLGLPAPQGSKKGFYNEKIGRVQMVESSKKVRPWRQDVKAAALDAIAEADWATITDGPVYLAIEFYLPRPKAHFGRRDGRPYLKPNAPTYSSSRPDKDKLERSTCDALTAAGVYGDDAQVADGSVSKKYAVGPDALLDQPGAIIYVAPIPAKPPAPLNAAERVDQVLESGQGVLL